METWRGSRVVVVSIPIVLVLPHPFIIDQRDWPLLY